MARHKDLTGSSLHETKLNASAGSPITLSTVASAAGILVYDSTASDRQGYLSKSTAAGDWIKFGGSGGGAGGGFKWQEGAGNPAPEQALEYEHIVRKFTKDDATAQSLYGVLRVPASYSAGNQIKLKIGAYTPSVANTWHMKAKATLVRAGTDALSSTTNQYTSTNSSVTADVADKLVVVELDLTSGSGQINSVAVSPGDLIGIELYRNSGTTDTADTRVLEDFSEFSFS